MQRGSGMELDKLRNELRNVLVGIWQRYELNADEPVVGVDLDPDQGNNVRIYPENDTAAFMMWGMDAFRQGATKK